MSSTSGPGTVVGSVNVETMENGDRSEEYLWELPCFASLADQARSSPCGCVTLPKPIFPKGVFSDPTWREKFSGTHLSGGLKFKFDIPYPEETSSSPYAWKLSIASVGLSDGIEGMLQEVSMEREGVQVQSLVGPNRSVGWKVEKNIIAADSATGRLRERLLHFRSNKPILVRIKILGTPIMDEKRADLNPLISATFNSPDLSDFKLLCQGETFLCHKYVLSLGSPVFKRMFLSQTKENKEGEVSIVGVPKETLGLMLAWMYGENIAPKLESLPARMELFKLADRYLLEALKESLINDILNTVTPETAFDIYVLGYACNEERLTAKAVEVMKRERKLVFDNDDVFNECYQRFPKLLKEILKGD